MARRRDKGLLELLALAPWWVSVIVAAAVYAGSRLAPSFIHSDRSVLAGINALAQVLSTHAHWVALPFLLVAAIAALNARRRRNLLDAQSGIESIRNLSWQEFELLVGEAFRRQYFLVNENGGGGEDGGVDLRIRRDGKTFIVQCKHWKSRRVGVSSVRELFGVMKAENADGAYIILSGLLSQSGLRFAQDNGVRVIAGTDLNDFISFAKQIKGGRETRSSPGAVGVPG